MNVSNKDISYKTCSLVLHHLSQKMFACINFVLMQLCNIIGRYHSYQQIRLSTDNQLITIFFPDGFFDLSMHTLGDNIIYQCMHYSEQSS